HAPPPLERLTLLVIAPGRTPVLLVPLLERPAALASPAAGWVGGLGWGGGGTGSRCSAGPTARTRTRLGPGSSRPAGWPSLTRRGPHTSLASRSRWRAVRSSPPAGGG